MIRITIADYGCPQRENSTIDFRKVIELLLRAVEQSCQLQMDFTLGLRQAEITCRAEASSLKVTVTDPKDAAFLSRLAEAYNPNIRPHALVLGTLTALPGALHGKGMPIGADSLDLRKLSYFAWYVGVLGESAGRAMEKALQTS